MENKATSTSKPKGPPLWAVDAAKRLSRGLLRVQRKLAPASATLLEMATSMWRPQAIWVVAELGIADHLEGGPLHVDELARRTQTNADALRRVLRPLAHDGILAMPSPDTFALAPLSQPLRSNHPTTMRQTIRQSLSSWNRRTWMELLEAVRTGEPQFARVHGGKSLWEWFATEAPADGRVFHDSMAELTRMTLPLLVAAYDFGKHARILDLGGGNATLIAGIARAYPGVRGGVLDLAGALADAPRTLDEAGVRERVELVEGDLFANVPSGWDAYILKHILHGSTDAQLASVLGAVRTALSPQARLIVIEMIVPDGSAGIYPAFLDLQMLVGSGGRERSVEDYRALFARHGLELETVARTAGPASLLVVKSSSAA